MAISDEQKKLRRGGLGGSDAPIVMGLSPWKTPYELFLIKSGQIEDVFEGNEATEWGDILEPVVADKYSSITGRKIRVDNKSYVSKTHPFMIGHIDRRVVGGEDRRALEVKTTSVPDGWGQSGSQEVPAHVLAQIQHYMHVIELDVVDVAVLIRGSDFRHYEIPRNQNMIEMLIDAEEEFWDRVQHKIAPTPDFEHRTMIELVQALYPGTNGSVIELPEVAQKYHDVMEDALNQRKMYDQVITGCKNRLGMLLGEASAGLLPDGTAYTRKLQTRAEHVVKATEFMTMRHTKKLPKELTDERDS